MKVTPKIKIAGGAVATVGGAYALYKAYKGKENKIAYGVVGGLLLVGGVLVAIKGWRQNSSLNAMPIQEVNKSSANPEIKKIIADAVKQGKTSNASGSEPAIAHSVPSQSHHKPAPASAPVKHHVQSQPTHQATPQATRQAKPQASEEWMNGKVVGSVDIKAIEASKARKENLLVRIEQLKKQHDQVKKTKGWNAALPLRNEIETLKAQLFWV